MARGGGKAFVFGGPLVTGGGGQTWTPASDSGTALWLDPTCGRSGTTWTDEAHATACTVSTNPPVYSDYATSGMPGVTPATTGGTVSCPIGSRLNGATGVTIFFVAKQLDSAAGYVMEYGNGTGLTTPGAFAILNKSGASQRLSAVAPGAGGNNRWDSTSGTVVSDTAAIYTVKIDYSLTSNSIAAIRMNGTALAGAYAVNTNPGATTLGNANLSISGQYNDTNPCGGIFGDIIVVNRALTAGEINRFESYLATKYGIPFSLAGRQSVRIINAGQSNALDYCTNTRTRSHQFNGPWTSPRIWAYRSSYIGASDLTETWQGMSGRQQGVVDAYGWTGSDLVACLRLLRNYDVAPEWIERVKGATSLAVDWNPSTGPEYATLVTTYTNALASHPSAPSSPITIVRCGQGESDAATPAYAAAYAANLAAWWTAIKTDLSIPSAKLVIDILRADCTSGASSDVAAVRAAQIAFVAADPTNRIGLYMDDVNGYDGVHWSDSAIVERGKRLANCVGTLLSLSAAETTSYYCSGNSDWDLSFLGLDVWQDAYDSATITYGSGTRVAAWANKGSIGGSFAQGTAGNQPSYGAFNGYPAVYGDSTQRWLEKTAPTWTEMEMFAVIQNPAGTPGNWSIWGMGNSGSPNVHPFSADGNLYDDSGSTTRRNFTIADLTNQMKNPTLIQIRSTSSDWTCWINGVQAYTTGTNTVAYPTLMMLMKDASNGNAFTGAIREFGMRRTVLTTDERNRLVAAMRLKWEVP